MLLPRPSVTDFTTVGRIAILEFPSFQNPLLGELVTVTKLNMMCFQRYEMRHAQNYWKK